MGELTQKLLALCVGTSIALFGSSLLGEFYLRYKTRDATINPFAHNPIIEAQASESTFFPDPILGHRLAPPFADIFSNEYNFQQSEDEKKKNRILPSSFIGVYKKKIQTIDEVIAEINLQKDTQPVILNLGDSSTSGWDSNVVSSNRAKRKEETRARPAYRSPFFKYKTYSDILAEQGYTIINAGVPGFTSSQGVRYIQRLLNEFKEYNIHIDYVTVYFGNNESVWNGNTQDKYVLPQQQFTLLLPGAVKTLLSDFTIYPRVNIGDYKRNIQRIVKITKQYGAQPIIIRPIIPKYWYPGLRAEQEDGKAEVWKMMYDHEGEKAITQLKQAIQMYEEAEHMLAIAGSDEQRQSAQGLFVEAQKLDYVVPRIKPVYVKALHDLTLRLNIPFIDVQDNIPIDDRKYFGDYCHPIEPANRLIATGIIESITLSAPR